MSEHEQTIHTEPAPFEQGYQPGTVPHISVPDLPDDAQGLTAEALAQVPTLTELVDDVVPVAALLAVTADPLVEAVSAPVAEADVLNIAPSDAPVAQDETLQADTWTEVLHARMGKLTDDIHSLNTRLDRLEERNKTKA
jgi:hypothetical protein